MRSSTSSILFVITVLAGSFSAHTLAQEESSRPVDESSPPPVATADVAPEEPESATPAQFVERPREPSVELAQSIGVSWGGYFFSEVATSFGVVLTDRVVWMTGGSFGIWNRADDFQRETSSMWNAATGPKLYIRAPRAHEFSPTLRLAVSYRGNRRVYEYESQSISGRTMTHSIGGQVAVGLSYFVTEQLALQLEAGVSAEGIVAARGSSVAGYGSGEPTGFGAGSTLGMSVVLRR